MAVLAAAQRFATAKFQTNILLILVLFQTGLCSKSYENFNENSEINTEVGNTSCELYYQNYLSIINNFTYCELNNASPFSLCISCAEMFQVAREMYTNLTEEPRHVDCKVKYMQSDKVQIIPTVQANMEAIWDKAHCQRPEDKKVICRADVTEFLELHENFSNCINTTTKGVHDLWTNEGNTSSKCKMCLKSYTLLNAHYNNMYSYDTGDVCMDIMYRMNYTRLLWALQLNCSHRESYHDLLPVVIISCVVASAPILFYVSLKVTGKVRRKKIFQQKRLGSSPNDSLTVSDHQGSSSESHALLHGRTYGAAGDTNRQRHATRE